LAAKPQAAFVILPRGHHCDITHEIRAQDIRYAALVLDDVTERFPEETAPVAARLSLGLDPDRLGPPLEKLVTPNGEARGFDARAGLAGCSARTSTANDARRRPPIGIVRLLTVAAAQSGSIGG